MIATIYTASRFLKTRKLGGFAYTIACGDVNMQVAGPLQKINSDQEAGLKVITKALEELDKARLPLTRIVVYTDKNVFHDISSQAPAGSAGWECFQVVHRLHLASNAWCEFRGLDSRASANSSDWCEQYAQKALRDQINH